MAGETIKLIKVKRDDGNWIYFNAVHVTHVIPVGENTSEITFVHGERVTVELRHDDLAARIARLTGSFQ